MLRNYFTLAVRILLKNKVFSLINIFGLSIGISCCILLALFVEDELSYEKHFEGYEQVYRVTSTFLGDESNDEIPRTSPPVAMTMIAEYPEVITATRIVSPPEVEQHLIRYGDNSFYEKLGYLVDSTFFEVFPYEFSEGDRATALDNPSRVVLSHLTAKKIFGNEPALDHQLIINSGASIDTFTVAGVLKPYRQKSQVDADFYMAMNSKGWGEYVNGVTSWVGQNFVFSFVRIRPDASADNLAAKFPELMEKYGADEMKEMGRRKTMGLQPLSEMHLYSTNRFIGVFGRMDLGTRGNITYLYVLGTISLFVLLIACINFTNLTTAKATQRAGEVGIRKSLGAMRQNLIKQFLGESMTLVVIAVILSIGLVQVFLPVFNDIVRKELTLRSGNVLYLFGTLSSVALLTGVLAGSYPAFFLSAFQPARVLKGKTLAGGGTNWLRKTLVVVQFVISITLVSSLLVIRKQMNHIENTSLGFSPERKMSVPLRTEEARENYLRFKNQLQQIAGITEVTGTSALPGSPTVRDLPLYPEGSSMENAVAHLNVNVDENYFDLLNIPLLTGRELVYETDSFNLTHNVNAIIINRAAMTTNNLTLDNAVGSNLYIDWQGSHKTFRIIGVVDDFHQLSMHQPVSPIIFLIPSSREGFVEVCVGIAGGDEGRTVAQVEKIWKELIPYTPFEFNFLADNISRQYENDRRVFEMIGVFTLIAIFISCLGLYGLSIFIAERKTKEIGIRKLLGASVSGIVGLLSKEIIVLVAIAFLMAVPVSYLVMSHWLENFAVQTELSLYLFLIAGSASLCIAWLTIGFESVKAALGNPVDSLHSD